MNGVYTVSFQEYRDLIVQGGVSKLVLHNKGASESVKYTQAW